MARTDNDTWDLATSVGATATGVAVGRALASRAGNPLIDDPFAEPLVRAVSRAVPIMADRMRQAVERWREHGFDVEMTDLWYDGDRHDVADYLGSHGWQVAASSVAELAAAHGLSTQTFDDDEAANFAGLGYVTATRR
jgi:O-methyltransferase involved in polyketide biosynthesis